MKSPINSVRRPFPLHSSVDLDDSEISEHSSVHNDFHFDRVKRHPPFRVKKTKEIQLQPLRKSKVKQILTPENLGNFIEDSVKRRKYQNTNSIEQKFTEKVSIIHICFILISQ